MKIFTQLILFFFFLTWINAFAQGNQFVFAPVNPSGLSVCGTAKTFTVNITNVSTTDYFNVLLTATMPMGVSYVPSTVVNASESDITIGNKPIFEIPTFTAGSTITVSFDALASCDLLQYIEHDWNIDNHYQVDYMGNLDSLRTNEYSVARPSLSYQSITNQTYNGQVGQSFSRVITIRNTGDGPLASLVFQDSIGSGITVTSMTPGTFSASTPMMSTTLSGVDFTTVGNHDAFLDPGEEIQITENITIIACSNLGSEYKLAWGCNSSTCVFTRNTGNVVISSGAPNVVFSIPNGAISTCYLNPSTRTLRIRNTGTEPARNISLDFRQNGANLYSYFDASSFTYKQGLSGPSTPLPLTSVINQAKTGAAATCLGVASAPNEVTFTIPILAPGDTIDIFFTTITCCPNTSCPVSSASAFSWIYDGSYQDQCLSNTFIIPYTSARGNMGTSQTNVNASGPVTMAPGATGTFCYSFPSSFSLWGTATNGYITTTFNLPTNFSFSGNPADLSFSNGSASWVPSSITVVGNIVTAQYNLPHPFGSNAYSGTSLCINLTNTCGTGGSKLISMNMKLTPNASCACESYFQCSRNFTTTSTCPVPCANGGPSMYGFSMERTNFGLPDTNNDGVADVSGTLDFSQIRKDRAMLGDTVKQTIRATIFTTAANPTWSYAYFRTVIGSSNTYRLAHIAKNIRIYDISTGLVYNCTPIETSSTSGGDSVYLYNFSVANMIAQGCLPPGFVFENGDSVVLELSYRLNRNVGNSTSTVNITNNMYTSNTPIVTHPGGNSCFNINGVYNWVGYTLDNTSLDYLTVSGCNNITASQNFGMSLGGTRNAFPGEFRNFSHLQQVQVKIPTGYTYVSAQFRQVRSAGTATVTQPYIPINPVNPTASTLIFNVGTYFTPTGTYDLSDDNYSGTFSMVIRPTCAVTPNIYQAVNYTFVYDTSAGLGTSQTAITNGPQRDSLMFNPPILHLQSSLPSIVATRDSVSWTVIVSNESSVSGSNVWFSLVNASGRIQIYNVTDITGVPFTVTPMNNIYQIGTLNGGGSRTYVISAKYTNCTKDSITVHTGWNCTGYPTNLASYTPCVSTQMKLYLRANVPVFTASISGPSAPVNLCDTINYEVTFTNTSDGRAYFPFIRLRRSNLGINIVPGSAEIMYPSGGSYTALADPTPAGADYMWMLGTLIPELTTQGVKSAPETPGNIFKIRFKMVTSCSFVSGSYLRFYISSKGGCGSVYTYTFNSPVVVIAGAPTKYTTAMSLQADTIRQCGVPVNYRVKIVNLGPGTTNPTDIFQMDLPSNITYVAGSTTDIYQGFTSDPNISLFGGDQRLKWDITGGVVPGDSIIFNFQVMPDDILTTGNYTNDLQTQIKVSLSCGATTCVIGNINGNSSSDVRVERPVGLWTGQMDSDWFNPRNWANCKVPDCSIDVTIPNVTNQPDINTSAIAATQDLTIQTGASVDLLAGSRLHICGDLTTQSASAFSSANNSEVHFTGSVPQTYTNLGTATFEKVWMEQITPQTLTLNQNLVANQSLTLTQGVIVTGVNEMVVVDGSANAVNAGNQNSYVQGTLRRGVTSTGTYYIPVGNASKGYELAEINLTAQGGVSEFITRFNDWAGAPYILNKTECSATFDQNALDHGYWTIQATGAINPVYDLSLHNRSYTNPMAGWTIMKKPTGSPDSNYDINTGTCSMYSTAALTLRYGLHSFSDFAVAQSATILPVELLNIRATAMDKYIQVSWKTQIENNLNGFEVQRSLDGLSYETIAYVQGKGNQSAYQHNDLQVKTGQLYMYRLKMVDMNGAFDFSPVVEAQLNTHPQSNVSVYPNPASDMLYLTIDQEKAYKGKIHLVNNLGQIVYIQDLTKSEGLYNTAIQLNTIPSGCYQLQIIGGEELLITKFCKQ